MQYLIHPKEGEPFFSKWFEPENDFSEGMTVYDLSNALYTTDGTTWNEIEFDHL